MATRCNLIINHWKICTLTRWLNVLLRKARCTRVLLVRQLEKRTVDRMGSESLDAHKRKVGNLSNSCSHTGPLNGSVWSLPLVLAARAQVVVLAPTRLNHKCETMTGSRMTICPYREVGEESRRVLRALLARHVVSLGIAQQVAQ